MGQRGKGNTEEHRGNYSETRITAGKKLTVKSGKDFNMTGGQAKGETVKVEVGVDLNLKSQQDRETYTEKNESTSGNMGIGADGECRTHFDRSPSIWQLTARKGDPTPEMPSATNIEVKGSK
ncbi:hemagglutinin repeat-containing protein [Acetonema longum]|uniref:Filamentous hemagglutinin outer membrane protein n=1 Tax=Acetonema longum DSM 6540 TaxID=1009370 RepID=F7NLX0_9FIRM|nr:hemagglutinin repeat-containing protein [Acetonema longum]EGO62960.1 filamentous hemagglutinin outer membrane protein [Acetonema longum DSM 6540]